MTDFDQFERRLADAIRSDADESVGPFTPESIARAAIAESGRDVTRVRRSSPRPVGRFGRGRGTTLLAAALLVGGGVLAAGSGLLRLPSVVPPAPVPSVALLATASPDATATPTPSVPPTPAPTPGLDVTWTQLSIGDQFAPWNGPTFSPRIAWIGDRFVLADIESGAVMTSADGENWQALQPGDAAQGYVDLLQGSYASWQDSFVGWWNPQELAQCMNCAGAPPITARDVVQIVQPPAAPMSTTPFKGRIGSMGIGPKGLVAEVHSHLDLDAWITEQLGLRTNNDWTCCVKDLTFKDGILELKLTNRRGLKVVWADQGFEPGDIFDTGFGWYSPDGEQWTEMPLNEESGSSLPNGRFGSVVGVSDGFIATGSFPDDTCDDPNGACTGMWFSPDGLNWSFLGTAPEVRSSAGSSLCIRDTCSVQPGELLPWKGGALAVAEDGRIALWTSAGSTELPIAADPNGTFATGPLGLVSFGDGEVLVSRDGIDYKVSPIAAGMADAAPGQQSSTVVVVGDRTVLVLQTERSGDPEVTRSLWLGTFEP